MHGDERGISRYRPKPHFTYQRLQWILDFEQCLFIFFDSNHQTDIYIFIKLDREALFCIITIFATCNYALAIWRSRLLHTEYIQHDISPLIYGRWTTPQPKSGSWSTGSMSIF